MVKLVIEVSRYLPLGVHMWIWHVTATSCCIIKHLVQPRWHHMIKTGTILLH